MENKKYTLYRIKIDYGTQAEGDGTAPKHYSDRGSNQY